MLHPIDNEVDEEFFTSVNGDGARFFKSARGIFVTVVIEPRFDVEV